MQNPDHFQNRRLFQNARGESDRPELQRGQAGIPRGSKWQPYVDVYWKWTSGLRRQGILNLKLAQELNSFKRPTAQRFISLL